MNNKMYFVTIENKKTRQIKITASTTTERAAERICESWGWSYDDGKTSFWMGYTENNKPIFDFISDAITDGKFEAVEDALDAIQTAYKADIITLAQREALLKCC